ncbi:MAG: hypothetical protein Q9167_003105 [Letrouitia subvulpina]
MSYPHPTSGQPPSFKTNVNRAKTKRWVEAKSYSYDGDDWGDVDDYDEYGGYDDPPPPPRSTGLRQRGQSITQTQPEMYNVQQEGYPRPPDNRKHGYGDIGRSIPAQAQSGARIATGPQYQSSELTRSGSFDRGDERRAFSAATSQHEKGEQQIRPQHTPSYPQGQRPTMEASPSRNQPSYTQNSQEPMQSKNIPLQQHSQGGPPSLQMETYPGAEASRRNNEDVQYPHRGNRGTPYSDRPRQPNMDSRTQSMTSNNSSLDFNNRHEFSSSAVPTPLTTRGSPSPHRTNDAQSTARRPPRKSSLGQQGAPETSNVANSFASAHVGSEGGPSSTRERTGSNTSKPLPLIRPADIYKRMQEEKERERQSQESSRPSMDVIMSGDGVSSSAQGFKMDQQGDTLASSESLEPAVEPDGSLRSKAKLDPVAERKSEYGTMVPETKHVLSETVSQVEEGPPTEPILSSRRENEKANPSPSLPTVNRMSDFGDIFTRPSQTVKEQRINPEQADEHSTDSAVDQTLQRHQDTALQHQPSLGFRSVVNQAFDSTHEPIPATPSSSTADSSIDRSGSGGTSAVSPIISRGPSTSTSNWRAAQERPVTPAKSGEEDGKGRPISSGSPSTPKQVAGKASASQSSSPDLVEPRPQNFKFGHRRNLSTPSPDNSPARTPAVEANKQLQEPQEAELATTTPTEPRFAPGQGFQSPTDFRNQEDSPTRPPNFANVPRPGSRTASPVPSTESPSYGHMDSPRNKVRDLAGKFESGRSSPVGSKSINPQRNNGPGSNLSKAQYSNQERPLADRMESFRPQLPGGWESTASIASLGSASDPKNDISGASSRVDKERMTEGAYTAPSISQSEATQNNSTNRSTTGYPDSSTSNEQIRRNDPFTDLAAAGNALAGAFSASFGPGQGQSPSAGLDERPPSRQLDSNHMDQSNEAARPRNASVNTAFIPEASKLSVPSPAEDGVSSIMPTPLDKMADTSPPDDSSGYFASQPPLQTRSEDRPRSVEENASSKRSQRLPALSTETKPQYESDRLRREIIRELSPMQASEPTTAGSGSLWRDDTDSSGRPSRTQTHESMVIPHEYDSYWRGSDSEDSSRHQSVHGLPNAMEDSLRPDEREQSYPVQTTSSSTEPQDISKTPQEQPPTTELRPEMHQQRFSWEGSSMGTPRASDLEMVGKPVSAGLVPPGTQTHDGNQSIASDNDPITTSDSSKLLQSELEHSQSNSPRLIQYADTETKNEPKGNAQIPLAPQVDHSQYIAGLNTNTPPPPSSDVQMDIQEFRQILAKRDPYERIRSYNESRHQYANMNTGLSYWLAVKIQELPEHADVTPNGSFTAPRGYKAASSKPKLGGLLTSATSTQQPYYQQYLNASPQPNFNSGNMSGGALPPQNFSPSSGGGGKLSSQQMQAKGKDLLHSAGIFGGKANVAAKGLFSKGKSRLKGGGSEKSSTSTEQRGIPGASESGLIQSLSMPSHQANDEEQLTSHDPSKSLEYPTEIATPQYTRHHAAQLTSNEWRQPEGEGTPIPRNVSPAPVQPSTMLESNPQHQELIDSHFSSTDSNPSQSQENAVNSARHIQPSSLLAQSSKLAQSSTDPLPNQQDHSTTPGRGVTPENSLSAQASHLNQRPKSKPEFPSGTDNLYLPKEHYSSVPRGPADRGTKQLSNRGEMPYQKQLAENLLGADSNPVVQPPNLASQQLSRESIQTSASNPRPFSFISFSQSPNPQPLQDYTHREPSIDSLPSQIHQDDRPPSPLSPQHSMIQESHEQRDRPGPVHHGVNHDFLPGGHQDLPGHRSRSNSRSTQDPNLHDHPAFREDHSPSAPYDLPSQHYQAPISREAAILPRQQTTEYQLDGVGPPHSSTTDRNSMSQRASRTSIFFRSSAAPSNVGESPAHDAPDSHREPSTSVSPVMQKRKSKRRTLFRSLTGSSKNDPGGETTTPKAPPAYDQINEERSPSSTNPSETVTPTNVPSKYRNRFSRSSTSNGSDQPESNKKKRFSAIGSLFGRSNAQSQRGPPQAQGSYQQDSQSQSARYSTSKTPKQDDHRSSESSQRQKDYDKLSQHVLGREGLLTQRPPRTTSMPQTESSLGQGSDQLEPNGAPARHGRADGVQAPESSVSEKETPSQRPRHSQTSSWSRGLSSTRLLDDHQLPERHGMANQSRNSRNSVTVRTTTRHSPAPPPNGRQNSSTTTTTTTTTFRPSKADPRQQPLGNSFPRPESPAPPPPPPKDHWHQSKSHHASLAAPPAASAPVLQTPVHPSPEVAPSQPKHSRSPSSQTNQSLPPIQTDIPTDPPKTDKVAPRPREQGNGGVQSAEARKLRQSQIEGTGSPQSAEARKLRQSQIESAGSPAELSAATTAGGGGGKDPDGSEDEEVIVMSATSFPGQEWQPSSFSRWEGD